MANIATLHRSSPLGTGPGQPSRQMFESTQLSVGEIAFLKVLSVRALKAGEGVIAEVLRPLPLQKPDKPCTLSGSESTLCGWLEPHAWLIVSDGALLAQAATGALVTDISDRIATFEVNGAGARDLIAAGCDPGLFTVGCFSRVRFGGIANVIVVRLQEQRYRLMVDVSVAESFAQWLRQTAAGGVVGQ